MVLLLLVVNACTTLEMSHSERILEIQRLQEMEIPLTEEEKQNLILNDHELRLKGLEDETNINATS